MAYRVLIPQDITTAGKDYLSERGYAIKKGSGLTAAAIAGDVVDCDAILARTADYPAAVLDAGPRLRVIGRHGVGVDNIDVQRAEELGIWVTNAPESNAETVAEHTLMLLMALAKNLTRVAGAFRGGDFEIRNRLIGMDVAGKTLGIIGLGRIGRLVAQKATAGLGLTVVGFDPYLPVERFPDEVRAVDRGELFRCSDFVSLHIPATPETKAYVGAGELAWMKSTAYLINAARGEVVDEQALESALRSGSLAGAGLDVFQNEPPVKDDPLLRMENVIATPHNAALTVECMDRMGVHAAMGIDDVLNGREPRWPVNTPRNPRRG